MALVKINRKLAALVKTWCFPANRPRWRVEFPIGLCKQLRPGDDGSSFLRLLPSVAQFHSARVKCTTRQRNELFKLSSRQLCGNVRHFFAEFRIRSGHLARRMQIGWMATFHEFSSNFGRVPSPLPGSFGTRAVPDVNSADVVQRQVESGDERTLKGHADPGPTTKLPLNWNRIGRQVSQSTAVPLFHATSSQTLWIDCQVKNHFSKRFNRNLWWGFYTEKFNPIWSILLSLTKFYKKEETTPEPSGGRDIQVRWHFGVRQVISNQPCARYRPLLSPAPSERATLEHFDSKFSLFLFCK